MPNLKQRMMNPLTAEQRMQELLGSAITTQALRSPNYQVSAPWSGRMGHVPQFDPFLIEHLLRQYQQTGQYRPMGAPP
jgi:hypothetical protein